MVEKRGKSGKILMENIIFIILNILFLMILILFLARQGQGAALLEQSYAKQIALLIDSAKPGMTFVLNMDKAKEIAEKNGIEFEDIIINAKNIITVKLNDKGGYSYSYFNDVGLSLYPDSSNPEDIDSYVFVIGDYN